MQTQGKAPNPDFDKEMAEIQKKEFNTA